MISVIIPAYNEGDQISKTINQLLLGDEDGLVGEIILSDGGSTDDTVSLAEAAGARVVSSPIKGRSAQMNYGAAHATGAILYFLHADTHPPKGFSRDIKEAAGSGFSAGCYRLTFDQPHWFLQANCWFTRFDINAFRFGDQSLFIDHILFKKIGGFCEKHVVMEDQQIIGRIKKTGRFTVLQKPVVTSARKYIDNGIFKTQFIFFIIYFMYQFGYPQHKLVETYRKLIKQDKV